MSINRNCFHIVFSPQHCLIIQKTTFYWMHRYKQFIEHFIMIISADKACTKLDETKILSAIKCIEKNHRWITMIRLTSRTVDSEFNSFSDLYIYNLHAHDHSTQLRKWNLFFTDRVPVEVASWKKKCDFVARSQNQFYIRKSKWYTQVYATTH